MTSYAEVQHRLKLYETGLMRIRTNEMVHPSAARALGEPRAMRTSSSSDR